MSPYDPQAVADLLSRVKSALGKKSEQTGEVPPKEEPKVLKEEESEEDETPEPESVSHESLGDIPEGSLRKNFRVEKRGHLYQVWCRICKGMWTSGSDDIDKSPFAGRWRDHVKIHEDQEAEVKDSSTVEGTG